MLFVRENEKRQHVVHCLRCAVAQEPNLRGFICLEEYTIDMLLQTYDQFVFKYDSESQSKAIASSSQPRRSIEAAVAS